MDFWRTLGSDTGDTTVCIFFLSGSWGNLSEVVWRMDRKNRDAGQVRGQASKRVYVNGMSRLMARLMQRKLPSTVSFHFSRS
jgi:hypothetical protein